MLSGDNSGMTGSVAVSQGTVVVSHANALGDGTAMTNVTTVSTGGRLVSNSAGFTTVAPIAAPIVLSGSGTLSTGATIGNFAVTTMTINSGNRIEFKIWDLNQTAGVGYDKIDFGALDLTGVTSANRVTIKLISMASASALGDAVNLELPTIPANFGTLDFGTYDFNNSNLGSGNVSDLFTFDASEFTYTGGTASDAGLWSIDFNAGAITLTAVPEPSTYGFGLGALALAAAAIRRRRQTKKA